MFDGGVTPDGGAPSPDAGWMPDAGATCDCRDGEVCVEGTCMRLPEMCPCPLESYCDVAHDTCVAGCLDDSDCSTGRICYADERTCRAGCREDGDCGAGAICEGLTCRAGCRGDSACGAGQICESMLCRAGCRGDGDCDAGWVCETGTLTCTRGCTADGECGSGSICESLRCRAGCREDATCGGGEICDATRCRAGCRNDRGCGSGEICDGTRCRGGCRDDGDCGASATCMDTPLTCATCPEDTYEPGDATITSGGRSYYETVTRVLCGARDMDRVVWNEGPPNPGYYRESIRASVSGADDSAITTFTISGSGWSEMHEVGGNGSLTLRSDMFDYYCFEGHCASSRYTIEFHTASEAPATVELTFSVSATR